MTDSFGARSTLAVGANEFEIFRLAAVEEGHVDRLPYSLKILLENLLRHEDGRDVTRDDILALANWDAKAVPNTEISFTPSRVVLQDFTGVPAVVDLAAMRSAMQRLGGDPKKINPLIPVDLVIDHSIQVDRFASRSALSRCSATICMSLPELATSMLAAAHSPEERGRVQGMNDMIVFGCVTMASLASGGLMNCSGGDVVSGWNAVNMAMAPFLMLAGGTLIKAGLIPANT